MGFSAVQPIRAIVMFPDRARVGYVIGWDAHGVPEAVHAAIKFDDRQRVEWVNAAAVSIAFPDL